MHAQVHRDLQTLSVNELLASARVSAKSRFGPRFPANSIKGLLEWVWYLAVLRLAAMETNKRFQCPPEREKTTEDFSFRTITRIEKFLQVFCLWML